MTGLSYATFEVGHSLKAQEVVYKGAHGFSLFLWKHRSSETHTVCLAQWPLSAGLGPSCRGAEGGCARAVLGAERARPQICSWLAGALRLCATACWLSHRIFSLIFSICPTMTYKDRHKPGFELWGVWYSNASKSHSRTCSRGQLPCLLSWREGNFPQVGLRSV